MSNFEFRDPWFLLAAFLAPLVYHLLAHRWQGTTLFSSLAVLDRLPPSPRARLAHTPAVLIAGSLVAMSVALAGPRSGDDHMRVHREGIAIMMVVDRSGSMAARDMVRGDLSVDRLTAVKAIFKQFVLGQGSDERWARSQTAGRADDVIGLVAFARWADGLCPLTTDHGNLVNILEDLEIVHEQSEDGTALGEGLALAVERLRGHRAKSKVVILLTDGVNNAGDISPQQAAELAGSLGVKVYVIGVGTDGIAHIPVVHPLTGQQVLRPFRAQIDTKTLEAIAQQTSGRYFRATDAHGLAEIYRQIDGLERTEITEERYLAYHEWYGVFTWAALGLLGGGGVLGGTFFRRIP